MSSLLGVILVGVVVVAMRVRYRLRQPEHTHGRTRVLWGVQRDHKPDRGLGNKLIGFPGDVWSFIKFYWKYRTRDMRPAPSYPEGDSGIYDLASGDGGKAVLLACTGDFGKGPKTRAGEVSAAMKATHPHFTMHLGDIYRAGLSDEVRRNFLGFGAGSVKWPDGSVGTLALPGNHEYLAGGAAFFDEVLPAMKVPGFGRPEPQKTSFFCLQNEQWRIIGLDTGSKSVHRFGMEMIIQLLTKVPVINRIPLIWDLKTWLPRSLMTWLEGVLADEADHPRGLIFMSHHQVYTALDGRGPNPKPGKQIAKLLGSERQAIWFHGHGHIQGTYGMQPLAGSAKNLSVAARAIGHGSDVDPVTLSKIKNRAEKYHLEFVDNRRSANTKHKKGESESPHNGFAVLTFEGPQLAVDYFTLKADSDGIELVLSESWTVDNKGCLTGPEYTNVLDHEDFITPKKWRL